MIDSLKAEKIKERLTDRQARRGYLEQEEMELMEALADLNVARVVLEVKDDTIKFLEECLAEAQQTIARLTAALIAERDDALIWDGIGTVNRINKVLEGETQP
ncbi:hypothetical protein P40081_15140 [Paenibacillus sp. FSL P4-0081]|uniref:hypothetical protein n=1 Tax=Paenibacillus sp. FSL P4-0081 TaxID=1536769 RepID=UPI0004F8F963|nr:hypothetical protein [Paenibacillus sp. FSL P4-0081]AIQ29337.1 hypothetical protein P40081_15140 [Paenibacillus sp. FSL P4-0081]